MKLSRIQPHQDIREKVRAAFSEFSKTNPANKWRRFPAELRALVREAYLLGVSKTDLVTLAGISISSVDRWCSGDSKVKALPVPLEAKARVLEVTGPATESPAGFVVRLPSGMVIEFNEGTVFSAELFTVLCRSEVGHASSR